MSCITHVFSFKTKREVWLSLDSIIKMTVCTNDRMHTHQGKSSYQS